MTQTNRNKGLIRMAIMGVAFITLTIILIVFQPGSPRHQQASAPVVTPDTTVTREAPVLEDMTPTSSVAAIQNTPQPIRPATTGEPTTVRDMTFAAISNLKAATTGEAPAPGEPGSLLHSVVQRSMGAAPSVAPAAPQPEQVSAAPQIMRPTSGTYFVRPGDTLVSIAQEMYGDVGMASEIFDNNKDVMSRPDNLRVGMVLALPTP